VTNSAWSLCCFTPGNCRHVPHRCWRRLSEK
jgi:hypothetical protein